MSVPKLPHPHNINIPHICPRTPPPPPDINIPNVFPQTPHMEPRLPKYKIPNLCPPTPLPWPHNINIPDICPQTPTPHTDPPISTFTISAPGPQPLPTILTSPMFVPHGTSPPIIKPPISVPQPPSYNIILLNFG